MKYVIAAKQEMIISFPTEKEADDYCEKMKSEDPNFDLLDYDDCGDDYRIRVIQSLPGVSFLLSSMGVDNDPNI